MPKGQQLLWMPNIVFQMVRGSELLREVGKKVAEKGAGKKPSELLVGSPALKQAAVAATADVLREAALELGANAPKQLLSAMPKRVTETLPFLLPNQAVFRVSPTLSKFDIRK